MVNQQVLLLNASNMEAFPVYPYAFIQVPAIARQFGVEVLCRDLLGISRDQWIKTISTLIEQQDPTMLLITLRNTDSIDADDYKQSESKSGFGPPYFPIEQTKELISAIRTISDLKIAVGGFGFSVMPEKLMHYLHPDLGVFGDPDAFFKYFREIQQGNYDQIANLLYFQDEHLFSNPHAFYPPLVGVEYTPQAIGEMMAFYKAFPSPGFYGAPIEIIRGCRYSCVFCSEPHVKGKLVRYRDQTTVMRDIKTLVDYGITQLYMISSELNPEGNAYILTLADRIRDFNEAQPKDRKVTWFGANYLLDFGTIEHELLYESGFTGGWFDITALDDKNACDMRTPYRNKNLIAHLKAYAQFQRAKIDLSLAQAASPSESTDSAGDAEQKDRSVHWSLFLGNPATTSKTVRNTLRVANQEGLAQRFDSCHINSNIRVFDYEEPDNDTLEVTYSVTPDLTHTSYCQILPSYAYPPALLRDFGSEKAINQMFDYIAKTYLSTEYQNTRNWHSFLRQRTSSPEIANWILELSSSKHIHLSTDVDLTLTNIVKPAPSLQQIFSEGEIPIEHSQAYDLLAKQIIDALQSACFEAFPELFGGLNFPASMRWIEQLTPYELAITVFSRWSTEQELLDAINEQTKLLSEQLQAYICFCVQAILYRFNILISPEYRELFVPVGETD